MTTQAAETQALAPVSPTTIQNQPLSGEDLNRSLNAFSSEKAFAAAQRMAKALASSTLVPTEYRNSIPNVIIALELAARIGASPFAVMQNIDIINGRPSWRASFLIATVNTCGRFTPLKFQWTRDKDGNALGCRAYARERESGDLCEGAQITWAMVKAEGWLDKKGSKWKTMSEQMFMYRAAAFWTRVYAPELSLGMHTSEEQIDMTVVAAEPQRVVQRSAHADELQALIESSGPPQGAHEVQRLPDAHPDAEPPYEDDPYEEPPQ